MRRTGLAIAFAASSACGFSPQQAATSDGHLPGDSATGDDATHEDATMPMGSGAYRKPITIHGAKVTGSQTDFPVWIDLSDADIAGRASASGADIFFTAANGSPLGYERERWNPASHRLLAWVDVPSLDHSTETTIYVEYGDLAKATAADPRAVFGSDFAAVWHLDDTLATTTIADATGLHAGTASGFALTGQGGGQLGGGIAFDGTGTSTIVFQNPLSGNGKHTISAWVKQLATTHTSTILVLGTSATDQARFLYGYSGNTNGNGIGCGLYSDDWYPANQDIEGNVWTYVVWTYEGPNKKNHLYKNGVEIGPPGGTASNNAANTTGTTGIIGYAPEPAFGTSTGMSGTLDELRIATVMRDPAWIATEYANQSDPATFFSVGAEQPAP